MPVQFSSIQFSSFQSNTFGPPPNLTWLGAGVGVGVGVGLGLAGLGLARLGSARRGSARLAAARSGFGPVGSASVVILVESPSDIRQGCEQHPMEQMFLRSADV